MLQMGETHENRPPGLEVHAAAHVDVGLLPEGLKCVCTSAPLRGDFHFRNGDSGVVETRFGVTGQGLFVLLENVVDVGVPAVEDGVPHGCGRVAHYAERLLHVRLFKIVGPFLGGFRGSFYVPGVCGLGRGCRR